jgi:hypothetical protein
MGNFVFLLSGLAGLAGLALAMLALMYIGVASPQVGSKILSKS